MSNIPTEIIADILSRQPVKTLLRFRCVSKPWCSLIDGQDFIKLHLERSTQTYSNTSLIVKHEKIHSLNLDSEIFVKLDHPLETPSYHTELLGSCNGLVCLCNTEYEVAVWNPSTRKHHVLPFMPILSSYANIEFGFGYDRMNHDYKVLRIAERYGRDGVSPKSEVVVYSLKSDSWRKIDDFPYQLFYTRECGVLVSGALHYVGSTTSDPEITVIVAFDLDVERYRLVPTPTPERVENHIVMMHLGVLGGSLCVITYFFGCDNNIWVMKDYGMKVWTKLIRFSPEVICSDFAFVSPLAYSKNGDAVLLGRVFTEPECVKLVWYDLKKKRLKMAKFRDVPKSFEAFFVSKTLVAASFVESLVPLKGGSEIGRKKQQEGEEGKKKKNGKKRDDFLSVGFKLVL